eukprot:496476-Pyramimonas_sp.AAC.2
MGKLMVMLLLAESSCNTPMSAHLGALPMMPSLTPSRRAVMSTTRMSDTSKVTQISLPIHTHHMSIHTHHRSIHKHHRSIHTHHMSIHTPHMLIYTEELTRSVGGQVGCEAVIPSRQLGP